MLKPFIAHLIGDFILQNEWMAVNKKQSFFASLIHVLVYILPFLLCSLQWWQIGLIAIQHFAQDKSEFVLWWLRKWKRVHPDHWKELPLYVDQAFHIVWIQIVIMLGSS